jgi:hypothetical protein
MVEREDVRAAIEARKELGEEMEPQVIDAFLERIEQRLEKRAPAQPAEHRMITPLALGSLGAGVGVTAVSTGMETGGVIVAIIAWVCIAIVNVAYARWR